MTVKSKQDQYIDIYQIGATPWVLDKPDFNLMAVVRGTPIPSCRVLEVGCGIGSDAVWLAQQGFQVTGLDVSRIAIERARKNAETAQVDCAFRQWDFMERDVDGLPFDFVYDRGCFHSYQSDVLRSQYAETVARHVKTGGLWLSIAGNADDLPRTSGILGGPPKHKASDIVRAVEPHFEIVSMYASHFESLHTRPPKVWVVVLRKRDNG
jgi:methyl halide transferase